MKDAPIGKEFSDLARDKGLTHIKLSPIDYSTFRFTERTREEGEKESNIWEDYVYGLLSGKLSSEEVSGTILKAAPEEIAELLNKAAQEQKSDESYDRVIASYMSSKGSSRLKGEAASKLFKLIDNLSPDLKNDFLSRSFEHISTDTSQAESIFSGMSREKLQETIEFMNKHASSVPTALKNIMNRLGSIQSERKFSFDILAGNTSVVHDIEIGSNLVGMFTEETFHRFVGDDYRKQLDKMIRNSAPRILLELEEVKEDCNEDIIDRITSEVMLEVLDTDIISAKDYLDVLTRLSEISEELVNTGRFEDVLNIYN
ncbi:MAG: hypothetical protein GWN86_28470, partial [Desulfobacterales bacterium]|nr:hypothetical protein [Desulfobacterales bacterium]